MLIFPLYLARHFLTRFVLVFGFFFLVLLLADLIDLSRSVSGTSNIDYGSLFLVSLLRVPLLSGEVFPFVIFFTGLLSFSILSRHLELVVARASGLSVWRFLSPVFLVTLLLGIFSFAFWEPLSLSASRFSHSIEAQLYERGIESSRSSNLWLRLGRDSGDIVLRARISEDSARRLTGIDAWLYDTTGAYTDRFYATHARYTTNAYEFLDVTRTTSGIESREASLTIPINLSASELTESVTSPESIDFWHLLSASERATDSSRPSAPYLARFFSLLSHPFLFLSMCLLSACVCLGFSRLGMNRYGVWGGILSAFVLYIVSRLLLPFGINGLVSPFLSAFFPSLFALLVCATILLYREDG